MTTCLLHQMAEPFQNGSSFQRLQENFFLKRSPSEMYDISSLKVFLLLSIFIYHVYLNPYLCNFMVNFYH